MLYLIFGAGLVGVLGHWVTRWSQGRTQSTFLDYLITNKSHTISSLFANIMSSGVIYSSTPEDIAGRSLTLVVIGAYSAGYMLDSTLNKDQSSIEIIVAEKLKEIRLEGQHDESVDDILRDINAD
jgi:hypothetical protein